METTSDSDVQIGDATKRIARRLVAICENRLQLLTVEVQEERERLIQAFSFALGAAAFGFLAGMALTLLIAVAFWEHSPVIALLVVVVVYTVAALLFYGRLVRIKKDWETLSGTIDQLKKDRECLEKTFH